MKTAREYILAYDLGTGGLKASLYDSGGKLVDIVFQEYPTYSHQANWAEQDPETWWMAFCSSTKAILEKNKISPTKIVVISFSGQMMGCLPVDKTGKPLMNSIIWADRRSSEQAQLLMREIKEDDFYKITGNRIYPTYPIAKIMWVKENRPAIYEKTYKFLQAKDYIVLKLTGQFVTDYSDASGTALLHIEKRSWSSEALKIAGIDEKKLPEIHASTEIVGKIKKDVSIESGLKSGMPVVLGGGDGPCATLGAGVIREGSAHIYLGTSSWVSSASKAMVYDPQMVIFNIYHVNSSLISAFGTMQSGGGSYLWLKNCICSTETQMARMTNKSAYTFMNMQAETSPSGANNLIFLPYLRGERSPYWNPKAKGAFIGLTASHKRSDIIRAVMEGVAFNLKIIRDTFGQRKTKISELRIIGGGANSYLWRQVIADVFNETVYVPSLLEEANSLGAAIVGGVGIGLFENFNVVDKLNPIAQVQEPNKDVKIRKRYDHLFRVFNATYQALVPIFDQL